MRTGQEVPETSVVRSHGCGRERTKRKFEVWGERLKKSFTVDMAKLCQIWTYFPGEWYVIQTTTGREEELTDVLKSMLPQTICEKSFFIRRETCWRLKGKHKIQQEVLFPGYVFVQTQAPETLFYQLKKVPKLSKLLSDGEEEFLPVREEEQEFLEAIDVEQFNRDMQDLLDGKEVYLVKRSEIQVDEEGNIVWAGTPLSRYIGNVVRKRIRKRYVVIEKELFGKKRTVLLSVRLKGEE